MTYELDPEGEAMLAAFEGTVTHPYWDQAGVATICTGHAIRSSEAAVYPFGESVSQETCQALLRGDLAGAVGDVNRMVLPRVRLTQRQFSALVDFQFNTGGLAHSSVLSKLNAGDYFGAADAFLAWNHRRDPRTGKLVEDPGLTKRRETERRMFLSGTLLPELSPKSLAALISEANLEQFDIASLVDVTSPLAPEDRETEPNPLREAPTMPDRLVSLPPKESEEPA